MDCPYCGRGSRVLDSRRSGEDIRRRRECLECHRRFTTYESLAAPEIRVSKRHGRETEDFDRGKLLAVLARITHDRPVSQNSLEELVRALEAELVDQGAPVLESWRIAEKLLARLRDLDAISATRFASNYILDDGSIGFAGRESSQLPLPFLWEHGQPERARPRSRKPRVGSPQNS